MIYKQLKTNKQKKNISMPGSQHFTVRSWVAGQLMGMMGVFNSPSHDIQDQFEDCIGKKFGNFIKLHKMVKQKLHIVALSNANFLRSYF